MSIGPLVAKAFVKAQAELQAVAKASENPHFKSKFASLDDIIASVRPVLAAHGLAVSQTARRDESQAAIILTTTILHESGESFDRDVFVPLAKFDPQGAGSTLTYARRYGISAALGIATETDDDGNGAQAKPQQRKQQNTRPEKGGETRAVPTSGGSASRPLSPPPSQSASSAKLNIRTHMPAGKHKGQEYKWIPTKDLEAAYQYYSSEAGNDELVAILADVLDARSAEKTDAAVAKMQKDEDKAQDALPFAR